ncbi:hypothetical protein QUF61_11795 [Candidatus Venteria ishoeyi]|uniref:hypothetical protein n=1 Tax=Candidatus Venteria ishoeyi TaxID=1899563 RepID=UPI0025A589D2|nr:hypothetical protein [Candidatus Venteria ishoeyi]MDM8547168.1 hypothetical protein [Candidatus Venteria ishoeyi]
MTKLSTQNTYQDSFNTLIKKGYSESDAIIKQTHKYLDNKPSKIKKQNISHKERDNAFWRSQFWQQVDKQVFDSEAFILALTRFFQQKSVDFQFLQKVVLSSPNSFKQAIRHSKVFIQHQDHPRWKTVQEILDTSPDFSEFNKACHIISDQFHTRKDHLKKSEVVLSEFSFLEFLFYTTLYGFKHLVGNAPAITHHSRQIHNFQASTQAINQLLLTKLELCLPDEFKLNQEFIYTEINKHFIWGEKISKNIADKLSKFESLVKIQKDFIVFKNSSFDTFCYDENFELHTQNGELVLCVADIEKFRNWKRDGEKLLHYSELYWNNIVVEEFQNYKLKDKIFGSKEYHEYNQNAWLLANKYQNILYELYGIDKLINTETATVRNSTYILEMICADFKSNFIVPYSEFLQNTQDWKQAFQKFIVANILKGKPRIPLDFIDQQERVQQIAKSEKILEKDAQVIVDLWSTDIKALSKSLQNPKNGQREPFRELFEKPFLKVGRWLFQFPWQLAQQNNGTAIINNLRRFHNKRPSLKDETDRIEKNLALLFQKFGFNVIQSYQPPRTNEGEVGDIDVICAKDEHVFVFELKSTYVRTTLETAWKHKTDTLRKAGLQLKRKLPHVISTLNTDAELKEKLGIIQVDENKIHAWIIDTSFENDHEKFSGFLKVSLLEVIIALCNHRFYARDLASALKINEGFQTWDIKQQNANVEAMLSPEASQIIEDIIKKDDLYPNGFSVGRFAEIIEKEEVWEVIGEVVITQRELVRHL